MANISLDGKCKIDKLLLGKAVIFSPGKLLIGGDYDIYSFFKTFLSETLITSCYISQVIHQHEL